MRQRFGSISLSVVCLVGLGILQAGCIATLDDTYYLEAHDPKTGITNFFRIHLSGHAHLSQAKYSMGFYDREAVERLFGETSIQKEFLAGRLGIMSVESDKDLKELASTLDKINNINRGLARERLLLASGTAAGLIARYQARFDATPDLSKLWNASLQRARAAQDQAQKILQAAQDPNAADLGTAQGHIREAQVILETIRIAVDGTVLVRSFDGAGNEVDVTTKTLVIFVASDVSRFAEALRQLAESEEAKQNLLMAVLGDKIQEFEMVAKRLATSDSQAEVVGKRLADILAEVKGIPAAKTGDAAAQEAERKKEAAKLKTKILESAAAVASKGTEFKGADEIRSFAAGLGDGNE